MAAQKRRVLRQKSPPIPVTAPESVSAGSLADVPDPPGLAVNDAVFTVLRDVSTELHGVRTELMQIHGIARCLCDVLKYADDDDSVMHSDVAHVIGRLLNDQVTEIELIRNRIPTTKEQAAKIVDASDREVEA